MPSRVPSQAQHSRFMRALDLRLESCIEGEGPTFARKVVPAYLLRQTVNRHGMTQPHPDVVCQMSCSNVNQVFY